MPVQIRLPMKRVLARAHVCKLTGLSQFYISCRKPRNVFPQ